MPMQNRSVYSADHALFRDTARRFYREVLPGIPTIRVFEALARVVGVREVDALTPAVAGRVRARFGDRVRLCLPEGVELLSDPEEVAATVTQPTEITDEEMEAAGIVEEESDEEAAAAEEAEGVEEEAEGDGEAPEEDGDAEENE